jgi:glutamyl-Q tRNA(Asp) synthetase
MSVARPVIGRFAPSPTGPLHQGSLLAAMASYLSARTRHGQWLVRMEDIDTTRSRAHYVSMILRQLDVLGFEWDGDILYQSTRNEAYRAALDSLRRQDRLYACDCRRAIRIGGKGYTGVCRERGLPLQETYAWRLRAEKTVARFFDRIQGDCSWQEALGAADLVLRRADGLFAYPLAVVVDDAAQGVTDVVRGADLLTATPPQRYLQALLGYAEVTYAHVPLLLQADGRKLSKRDQAPALTPTAALTDLQQAWVYLGQRPLVSCGSVTEFWAQAKLKWNEARIPRQAQRKS